MGPHVRAHRYAPGDIIYSYLLIMFFCSVFCILFVCFCFLILLFSFLIVYQLHFRTCEGYIYFGRRGAIGGPVLGGSRGGIWGGPGGGGRGGGAGGGGRA